MRGRGLLTGALVPAATASTDISLVWITPLSNTNRSVPVVSWSSVYKQLGVEQQDWQDYNLRTNSNSSLARNSCGACSYAQLLTQYVLISAALLLQL